MTTSQYNKKRDAILQTKSKDKETKKINLWFTYIHENVKINRLTIKN